MSNGPVEVDAIVISDFFVSLVRMHARLDLRIRLCFKTSKTAVESELMTSIAHELHNLEGSNL